MALKSEGAPDAAKVLSILRGLSPEKEWQARVSEIESCLKAESPVSDFVDNLGLKGLCENQHPCCGETLTQRLNTTRTEGEGVCTL